MAIIVEDGTGKIDSETLISVADADAYFASRGNTVWSTIATDEEKEHLLRKSSDYILGTYGPRWAGRRVFSQQALDWPRANVVANGFLVESNSVPLLVTNASAELALQAISGDLLPKTEFNDFATSETKHVQIDRLLSSFFSFSGLTVNLVRS